MRGGDFSDEEEKDALINLNFTLVIQLVNFLILLVVLNFLLFKPILRVIDEREKVLKESREIKEKFTVLADEGISRYERKLLEAKQEAMAVRSNLRNEVMTDFRKKVFQAKEKGLEEFEEARREISREAEKSRVTLKKQADDLGVLIASRLAGREM